MRPVSSPTSSEEPTEYKQKSILRKAKESRELIIMQVN